MDIKDIRDKYPQYSDLSDEKLLHGLHAKFYADMPYDQFSSKITGATQKEQSQPSAWDEIKTGAKNTAIGAIRGAARIGQVLQYPLDAAGLTSYTPEARNVAIEQFASENANPDAGSYIGGDIAAQIAGTAGMGRLLATGAKAIPGLTPKIAASLESGGFSLGAPAATTIGGKLGNAAIRLGGGALTGAAGAGAVGAGVGTGAAVGAALPGALGPLSGGARRVVSPVFTPRDSAIRNMEQAAGGKDRLVDAVRKATESAQDLPLGSRMTMGQTSGNEGIAALERAASGRNAAAFQDVYSSQRRSMTDAIEELSGTDALRNKIVQNRSNMTEPLYSANNNKLVSGKAIDDLIDRTPPSVISDALRNSRMRGEVPIRSVYEPVPSSSVTLDDLEGLRSTMPNVGNFNTGAKDVAKQIEKQQGLLSYLRSNGGISSDELAEITGEKIINRSGVQVGTFSRRGRPIDDAVLKAVEGGYLPRDILDSTDGGVQYLRDALKEEAQGGAKTLRLNALDDMNFNDLYPAPDMPLDPLSVVGKSAKPLGMEYETAGKQYSGGMIDALRKELSSKKDVAFRAGDSNAGSGYGSLLNDVRSFQETATPEGALANKLFRELSPDLNRIDVARALRDKLVPALNQSTGVDLKLTGAQYAKALKDASELVRKETGQNQTISQLFADTPDKLQKLTDIERLVSGQSYLNQAGTGANSTTAQLQQYAGLLKSISEGAGGIADKTGKVITHFSRTEGAINELLQNPQLLADALRKAESRGLIANPTNSAFRSVLTQRGE